MSFRVDTYILPISPRVCKNTARSTKNTVAFWNVRTKSRLFTQLADLADESSCMQREKRSRACKLYDAYRIIALYRERFDVCRFAKVKVNKKTPSLSGTFERSHGIFHKHREVKRPRSTKNTAAFWNVRTKRIKPIQTGSTFTTL